MYRVLMPVDSSESRGKAQAEAVEAMPGASDSARVLLLYAFEDEERRRTTSPRQVPGGSTAYDRLQSAGISVEQVSRAGDPAAAILEVAEDREVDHIVLGGRKRSPARSLLLGSVTQAVLLDADQPVSVTGDEK
jgi:nucleotide-binding universal stress UspA family protein